MYTAWYPWLKLHFLLVSWVGGSEGAHWKSFECTMDLGQLSCHIHIHSIWFIWYTPFSVSVAWFESFIRSVVPLTKLIQPCAARKLLRRFDTSLHVDLQQRSCEFLELLHSEWDPHRPGLLFRKKWVSWICLIKRPSGKDVMVHWQIYGFCLKIIGCYIKQYRGFLHKNEMFCPLTRNFRSNASARERDRRCWQSRRSCASGCRNRWC